MSRDETFAALDLDPHKRNLLVTFHPVTLDAESSVAQIGELFGALDDLGPDTGMILTGPNADTEGRVLTRSIEDFVASRDNAFFNVSLGQTLYLNALKQVDAIVGNSSSGLYEAPSFKTPTVDIGDRQKGRLKAESVVECAPKRKAIAAAIRKAVKLDCSDTVNPYGDGQTSPRIVARLKAVGDPQALFKKHFFNLEAP